ncbi:MAG: oxaloacetate decarboxylase alpha subunit [Methanomicrobia archaeon]|nr:oxaloacetate decarboxylase alpha subunit [Methanomicrobia archaeon]
MAKPASTKLRITDTTLRDAHQSLIATRLRTDDSVPLARLIDKAGFCPDAAPRPEPGGIPPLPG